MPMEVTETDVTVSCRPFRCLLRSRQQGWLDLTRQNFGKFFNSFFFFLGEKCVYEFDLERGLIITEKYHWDEGGWGPREHVGSVG